MVVMCDYKLPLATALVAKRPAHVAIMGLGNVDLLLLNFVVDDD